MFEYIRKYLPWRIRERKNKENFIKTLQEPGHNKQKVRFKNINKIPVGAIILLQDYSDNSIITTVWHGSRWSMLGSNSSRLRTITSIELEDILTEKCNKATATAKFLIFDSSQLLDINYKKYPSTAGFAKVQWHDIGNNEDE